MLGLCSNGKEWASTEGSNRAFREDSEVRSKSVVTKQQRSAPASQDSVHLSKFNYSRSMAVCLTQQLVLK